MYTVTTFINGGLTTLELHFDGVRRAGEVKRRRSVSIFLGSKPGGGGSSGHLNFLYLRLTDFEIVSFPSPICTTYYVYETWPASIRLCTNPIEPLQFMDGDRISSLPEPLEEERWMLKKMKKKSMTLGNPTERVKIKTHFRTFKSGSCFFFLDRLSRGGQNNNGKAHREFVSPGGCSPGCWLKGDKNILLAGV